MNFAYKQYACIFNKFGIKETYSLCENRSTRIKNQTNDELRWTKRIMSRCGKPTIKKNCTERGLLKVMRLKIRFIPLKCYNIKCSPIPARILFQSCISS